MIPYICKPDRPSVLHRLLEEYEEFFLKVE